VNIVVLHDGKGGHLSQSLGLAKLIEKHSAVAVNIVACSAKPRIKLFNSPLRALAASRKRWHLPILFRCYRWKKPQHRPDLIISFGGNLVALNAALRTYWQVPAIAMGNTYSIPSDCFDGRVTITGRESPQCLASKVALCRIDPLSAQRQGQTLATKLGCDRSWALLIGGPSSRYHYTENDWHRLGQNLQYLSQQHNRRWLLTCSRRTPQVAKKILRRYVNEQNTLATVKLGHELDRDITIEAMLGAAQRIVCTEDSLSMVTEVCAVNKPVVTVRPENTRNQGVHAETMSYMAQAQLIERQTIEHMHQLEINALNPAKTYEEHLSALYQKLAPVLRLAENREYPLIARRKETAPIFAH
jgi:mitochondrial fission protein ELM1